MIWIEGHPKVKLFGIYLVRLHNGEYVIASWRVDHWGHRQIHQGKDVTHHMLIKEPGSK